MDRSLLICDSVFPLYVCSDSSLSKQQCLQLPEKEKSVQNNALNSSSVLNSSIGGGSANGSSVYVIDEHFAQTLFATEV